MRKIDKIVILISSSKKGGAQILLVNLAERLYKEMDMLIICPNGFLYEKLQEIGVNLIESEVNFKRIGSLREQILKWAGSDDCIINPFLFGTSFYCAWAFRNDDNCHVFSYLHNPIVRDDLSWLQKKVYLFIAKVIGRYSDVIGVGSPDLFKQVHSITGKDPVYLENRVPNKVPPKECFYDGTRPLKVCYVGRMAEEKRPDMFVRTAKITHDENACIHYFMAGEGVLKENILKFISDNNLSQTVEMVGFIDNIYSFLGEMDVLLITSEYENSPLAVLEAMNASLAVVTGDVVGIPHLINNGVDGIVAKIYSEKCFADILIDLSDNPQRVENMGRRSYKKAITEFSYDRFVDLYLNALWMQ